MGFDVTKRELYTLIKVTSEKLDTNNAPELKSEVVVVNSQGEKNIVLDLTDCKYCDSSGLRAILVTNRLCEDAIGACIISGLQPDVESIFRISMLHTVLLITRNVEEAEELLKKKATLTDETVDNDL
ncbi:MAG: STAS domain-containing protein [Prolixibacteraceae bacterium]|jgi:anti-anti-sigma factor|nr:STAS domain-containing protein [Prolixibacteraceae bacterium]NLX28816.1 STAS domain-containing protein [Bacteroidales bacterium]HOY52112.1 STAS domain-containing protein [Prolixibacteraceae bacterium]HPJ77421.1 STAS domain-containing protein [Prolixibacteraceae bacterium]HRV88254.1 STAS domain-containing protein [Prolixibacteraceae bacterium]